MDRRRFLTVLGTTGTVAFTGCADRESSAGNGYTPDVSDDSNGGRGEGTRILTDTAYEIPGGQYQTVTFTVDSQRRIQYDFVVREGPAIDLYVMSQTEYEHFENGGRFEFVSDASRANTADETVSSSLSSGEYVLLIDNTRKGSAGPSTDGGDGSTTVEIEAALS